ncbi:MAG: hypothetical protein GXP47_06280 [Acidobacteria bacterium]|nr:hypothetical protein [Acidobacteriota bacterium]
MANAEHVERLHKGVEVWNAWRRENPAVRPDLSGEDLSEMDLRGINLGEADLKDAELFHADLSEANLKMAVLRGADLSGACLAGAALYKADLTGAHLIETDLTAANLGSIEARDADLRGVTLRDADLSGASLREANLTMGNLTKANLARADITKADLRSANLDKANLSGMRAGGFRRMRGRYHGVRGLSSCFGNPLFVRDARDQDYLDAMEVSIDETPSALKRRWKRFWFDAWGLIDFGRSLGKLAFGALVVMVIFGIVLHLDATQGWHLFVYHTPANGSLTPYYVSVITFTRLGAGSITPVHWLGEVVLVIERLLGYVTLGLLLSILINRVARRS